MTLYASEPTLRDALKFSASMLCRGLPPPTAEELATEAVKAASGWLREAATEIWWCEWASDHGKRTTGPRHSCIEEIDEFGCGPRLVVDPAMLAGGDDG